MNLASTCFHRNPLEAMAGTLSARTAVMALPLFCGLVALPSMARATAAQEVSPAEFVQLAARCGAAVAPETLLSIAKVESNLQSLVIHDNTTGRSYRPEEAADAIRIAEPLLAAGHSIDTGIMQINAANLMLFGVALDDAFDACTSITVASRILVADYSGGQSHAAQQMALRDALSRYNTGDQKDGFSNGYVRKVELAAREIVPAIDTGQPSSVADAPSSAPAAESDTDWDVWDNLESNDGAAVQMSTHPAWKAAPQTSAVFPDSGQ